MAGLIASLDAQASVEIDLSGLIAELNRIAAAVEALRQGPDLVAGLRQAIADLPLPPGLDGLAGLSSALDSLPALLRLDGAALVAPLVQPFASVGVRLEISASGNIGGIVALLRQGLAIATGRQHGGPQFMPDGAELPQQQKPDLAEIRAAAAEARAALAALGPFDAVSLLDRLTRAARGFQTPLARFMPVPLVDDLMQALATVESWRGQSGPQLAASLGHSLNLLAQLLDLPTTRVAQPILAGAAELSAAAARLPALVTDARALAAGDAGTDLAGPLAAGLDALAAALDPESGPFAALRELPNDLTHARLAAIRAVEPAGGIGPLASQLQAIIATIPPVGADPMAEIVTAIADFDLGALTDGLAAVRSVLEETLAAAQDARATVRDGLTAALAPADTAVAAAVAAFDPAAITQALGDVPGAIQGFVDSSITPVAGPLRAAISTAVAAIGEVQAGFDPARLIAPIRAAMEEAAALINDPAVAAAFADVGRVLEQVLEAISSIDLTGAADEVVDQLGEIEGKMAEIDPAAIPDPVKPPLREAVSFLTGLDFQAEINGPILDVAAQVAGGAGVALRAVEEGLEEVRLRVEKFRPSAMIAADLGGPFAALRTSLAGFRPSQLLHPVNAELAGLSARANILPSGVILDPLRAARAGLSGALDAIRPSHLLQPVETAISDAVARALAASNFDTAFEGLQDLLAEVTVWVDLANDLRAVLEDAAALFSAPGDGEQAVRDFVEEALDRLDPLAIADLADGFEAVAAANARSQRAALAGQLSPALRAADAAAVALAASPHIAALAAAVAGLDGHPAVQAAYARFTAALTGWTRLRDDIDEVAGALFERLADYQLAEIRDGGSVLDPLMARPATTAALKAAIRPALEDAVRAPLLLLNALMAAVSPYLAGMAGGLAALIGAAHAKVHAITGAAGVGGVVNGLDDLLDLLRDFDLSPVSAPADAILDRIAAALDALDPDALEAAIDGANAAVGGLLDLDLLVPETEIRSLDSQYQGAVASLMQLDPTAILSAELDPLFEDLMANVLPLFDLPARLRAASDAAIAALGSSLVAELGRVELAFDDMLRAIPLEGGGPASVSVSASVSVG